MERGVGHLPGGGVKGYKMHSGNPGLRLRVESCLDELEASEELSAQKHISEGGKRWSACYNPCEHVCNSTKR